MTLCFLRKASLSRRGLTGNEALGTVTPRRIHRGAACTVACCYRATNGPSLAGARRCGRRHCRTRAARLAVEVCHRFLVPRYLGFYGGGGVWNSTWTGDRVAPAIGNGVESANPDLPSDFSTGVDSNLDSLVRGGRHGRDIPDFSRILPASCGDRHECRRRYSTGPY